MAKKSATASQPHISPDVFKQAEAVARIAIDLAKNQDNASWPKHVEDELPYAWAILRKACLEIFTSGRTKVAEDYQNLGLRPPPELLPETDPNKIRVGFDKLFNKAMGTVRIQGVNEQGKKGSILWKQLSWTPNDPPSEQIKSRAYLLAAQHIRSKKAQELARARDDVINDLCHGFHGNWYWFQGKLWECFRIPSDDSMLAEECAKSSQRPHSGSVSLVYCRQVEPDDQLNYVSLPQRLHQNEAGLDGEPPSADKSEEELYSELYRWAEGVYDRWVERVCRRAVDEFWSEGKAKGFLWPDVLGMWKLKRQAHKWFDD